VLKFGDGDFVLGFAVRAWPARRDEPARLLREIAAIGGSVREPGYIRPAQVL